MPTVIDKDIRPYHLAIYEAIREAWIDYGASPSRDELSQAVKCSLATVNQGIAVLRQRGYIEAPKYAVRMLKPTDINRVVLRAPPDPWDDLLPPKKYWTGTRKDRYHEPDVT